MASSPMRTRSHQLCRTVWARPSENVICGSNWARFDHSRTTKIPRNSTRILDRSQNDMGLRVGRSLSRGRLVVALVGVEPSGTGLLGGSGMAGTGRSSLIASLLASSLLEGPRAHDLVDEVLVGGEAVG